MINMQGGGNLSPLQSQTTSIAPKVDPNVKSISIEGVKPQDLEVMGINK